MSRLLHRLFVEHPASVDEGYFEHARAALGYAGTFAVCSLCALVHALIPGLFTTSASRRLCAMHAHLQGRGLVDAAEPAATDPQQAAA